MPYTLPDLPYSYDALEPYIDKETMELHYTRHHAGYVEKLNAALEAFPGVSNQALAAGIKDLNIFPEPTRTAVRNNGGGHLNHSLFWTIMSPNGGGEPKGSVASAITKELGSFEAFKEDFNRKAASVFGSGWAWLCVDKDGRLVVTTTPNQDSPLMNDLTPILGLDVWEHAYYLHYQNRRPSYIDAWWHVVNWDQVEQNYRALVD